MQSMKICDIHLHMLIYTTHALTHTWSHTYIPTAGVTYILG